MKHDMAVFGLSGGSLGHVTGPLLRSDFWRAWNGDPAILACLVAGTVAHRRSIAGTGPDDKARWKRRAFGLGILATAVALVSPINALSGSLASAQMVQHLLLTVAAAPLLVLGAPASFPAALSRRLNRLRGWGATSSKAGTSSIVAWAVLHTAAIWFWHAGRTYDAALRNHLLHGVEHGVFFATALVSWSIVLGRDRHGRDRSGMQVAVLFGLSVQSALLGALLTSRRRRGTRRAGRQRQSGV